MRGATIGWNLFHEPADELFSAIEGTAYQTRVIFQRMAEHGVPIDRVINAGGIPRKSRALNQVYANVLGTPVLVARKDATGLGSAIFAFLALGTFQTVEEAQEALCSPVDTIEPEPRGVAACEDVFEHFCQLYQSFGRPDSSPVGLGQVLPSLSRVARQVRR